VADGKVRLVQYDTGSGVTGAIILGDSEGTGDENSDNYGKQFGVFYDRKNHSWVEFDAPLRAEGGGDTYQELS
jgi:hypothetical protein